VRIVTEEPAAAVRRRRYHLSIPVPRKPGAGCAGATVVVKIQYTWLALAAALGFAAPPPASGQAGGVRLARDLDALRRAAAACSWSREGELQQVLADPDEVRRSRKDPNVLLFYGGAGSRWLCAVARREDGTAFLITAYPTDAIKAGDTTWTRSK
jgi:hypothetical protein